MISWARHACTLAAGPGYGRTRCRRSFNVESVSSTAATLRNMAAIQGGMSRVRIELGDGLVGSILDRASSQSVQIVQGSLQEYDRLVAPRTVARVSQDPRRRG